MTGRNDNLWVNGGPKKQRSKTMKSEVKKETKPVSAFNMRWFAAGLFAMVAAWGVSLIGTHLSWAHGGRGVAQAVLAICLLVVFPLAGTIGLAACAWRATGVRRRMFAGVGLGMALGGALLTVVMFSSANRRAAVERIFAVVKE